MTRCGSPPRSSIHGLMISTGWARAWSRGLGEAAELRQPLEIADGRKDGGGAGGGDVVEHRGSRGP